MCFFTFLLDERNITCISCLTINFKLAGSSNSFAQVQEISRSDCPIVIKTSRSLGALMSMQCKQWACTKGADNVIGICKWDFSTNGQTCPFKS